MSPMHVRWHFSGVWLCATPWTADCQAPLSLGFSRQEYWVGCHALLQGISRPQDWTRVSRIAGGFFTVWATREAQCIKYFCLTLISLSAWRKQEEGRQEIMNLSDQDHVTTGQLLFSSVLIWLFVVVKLQTRWGNPVSLFIANYKICTWLQTFMIY